MYIISRYNQDMTPLLPYLDEYVLYDRSETPIEGSIKVPNIGTDIYDKLTFIIDNYENLPEILILIKANLFKYITEEEFIKVKDNKTFTPLLTQHHKVYEPICRYVDGMYEEVNNYWYLEHHKAEKKDELIEFLGINDKESLRFAPGANYIVPKENVLQHPKEFYVKLRSFLERDVYPGEAQIIERSLYYIWS